MWLVPSDLGRAKTESETFDYGPQGDHFLCEVVVRCVSGWADRWLFGDSWFLPFVGKRCGNETCGGEKNGRGSAHRISPGLKQVRAGSARFCGFQRSSVVWFLA